MGINRITFLGYRDYIGINLQAIIKDLDEDFHIRTDNIVKQLEILKKRVEEQRSSIDDPDSIEEKIDYFIKLFLIFRDDFKRLKSEMVILVENRHIELIGQIIDRCIYERPHARAFKNEHIVKSLIDESLRPLLDDIYAAFAIVVSDYPPVLGSMQKRLKTFIGTIIADDKNRQDQPKTPKIKVPPGTTWQDVQLMFRSTEIIEIKIKGKVCQNSNYEELGFVDQRSITKDNNKSKYNRLWGVLATYAKYDGEICFKYSSLPSRLSNKLTLKKDTSDLTRHFKSLFLLKNPPFYYSHKTKCYKANFTISILNPDIYIDILGFLSWK